MLIFGVHPARECDCTAENNYTTGGTHENEYMYKRAKECIRKGREHKKRYIV